MEDTAMENEEMKDRISHIIRAKNLTAAEFAIRLGIQPSNISHLLSGRNNPSLDFVKKLKETFPEYNLDWIIFGRGPMTVSEPFVDPVRFSHDDVVSSEANEDVPSSASINETALDAPIASVLSRQDAGIKGIVLLFDDDTFKILSPH